ncbi:hypothetical protein A2U01_0119636, partial [Trifolium medium]|nr:hypothetical protein [Trifolium medium]
MLAEVVTTQQDQPENVLPAPAISARGKEVLSE